MKVRYTRTAISEIDGIFSSVNQRDPDGAARVVDAVGRRVNRIAQFTISSTRWRARCSCRCCRPDSLF